MSIEKKLEELTTAINSLAVAILNQPQPETTPAPQPEPAPAPQPEPAPAQEAPTPAPKAKRKRRTKAEIEAEAQDDPTPAPKAATLSFQDVKAALLDLMKAQGAIAAKTILKTIGKVENVSALQEADYPAVMDAIQDKLGQGEIF